MVHTESENPMSGVEMRDMCKIAAMGLLENLEPGPARIMDDAVYVPVDFRVNVQDDARSRFEVAMMSLFERRKDSDRFDAYGIVRAIDAMA